MDNSGSLKTVVVEEDSHAVVRTDPRNPCVLEVIAIFYDAARARDYAELESKQPAEQPGVAAPVVSEKHIAKPTGDVSGLSERQTAVLKALRAKMDKDNIVAAKAAELAGAASIPLGSLHSVLQSLEKKQLIKAVRAGSARAPAVYQVL